MPTKDKAKRRIQNRNYQARLKSLRLWIIKQLGNRCVFWRTGECKGDLQLDHAYGHAGDDRPWTPLKYLREYKSNRLRVLCMLHNVRDGIERREIFRKQKLKNKIHSLIQKKIKNNFQKIENKNLSRAASGRSDFGGAMQVSGGTPRYAVIKIPVGNTFALVSECDFEKLSKRSWSLRRGHNTYYAYCGVYSKEKHRRKNADMHRMILDAPHGLQVDHINGNGLDNRRENLRLATASENQMNRRLGRNNTSGYKGVWVELYKGTERWRAALRLEGQTIHLGSFCTKEQAAEAYNKGAEKLFGEFARKNEIA